jgi:hypothetical protein
MANDSFKTLATTPPRKFIYHIKQANLRIAELENELAAAKTAPAAVAPAPSAPAAPPVQEKHGRERAVAAFTIAGAASTPQKIDPSLKGRAKFAAATIIAQ